MDTFPSTEGRKHDAAMLVDTQLYDSLQAHAFSTAGQPMCVYGDPAYLLRIHLQSPFRHHIVTPQMQAYNFAMSKVCTSVEWLLAI